jgi:hypothetical protein
VVVVVVVVMLWYGLLVWFADIGDGEVAIDWKGEEEDGNVRDYYGWKREICIYRALADEAIGLYYIDVPFLLANTVLIWDAYSIYSLVSGEPDNQKVKRSSNR